MHAIETFNKLLTRYTTVDFQVVCAVEPGWEQALVKVESWQSCYSTVSLYRAQILRIRKS
ncbi:unnamed protein product [Fusarium graminearum]|nr:unnamed protein product [Fusarium graminearum]